jgi:PAS domain S-box-containing protein
LHKQKNLTALVAFIVTVVAVFIGDLLLPQGMVVGFSYIIVLFAASRYLDPDKFKIITLLSSFFIIFIVFQQEFSINIFFNRLLALLLLWFIAYLLLKFRHMEEELKNSEYQYRSIVEATYDGIIISGSDGYIRFSNERITNLLGYSGEEILKHKFNDLIHSPGDSHPDYEDETAENELTLKKKDGTTLLVSVTFIPIIRKSQNPENLIVVRDISARKRTEEALKESQARLSGIVSSAMDAIITVNSDQDIVLFNKAAEKLFGYTKEEALGKHLGMLIPPDVKDAHKQYVRNFGETGTTNRHMGALGAVRGLKKNGEEFPIEASISQVSSSGEKLYSVILRDITERKLFEEKLNTSLKEKEVLLKEVHHRVKNNLQIMSSLLSLQSEYVQDERLAEMMIENQNRIKSMAMIHEKLYQTKALSKLDVHSYITELVNNLLRSYLHNNSQISLNLDIEHIELDVDSGIKLGLIINELVSNSLKYAFPDDFKGEKTIFIVLKKDVSISKIKLVVSDTGIGMKEGFELENAESLGLQLVDTFTQQLDGEFRFFNKNGTNIEIIF